MGRSIHTTRRELRKTIRADYSDPSRKSASIELAAKALSRKRRIKRLVARERQAGAHLTGVNEPDGFPIQVKDEGGKIHYPARPEDLQAIMKMLPSGSIEGLRTVELCFGKKYQESVDADKNELRDPWLKRISTEILPGVFESGQTLGVYYPRKNKIQLFAYVYDPAHLPLPRELCDLYCRLRSLSTFVHELAHHFDETTRIARGRWLSDKKEQFEWYAEKMEHTWVSEFVIPYLEKTYSRDAKALNDWIAQYAGINFPWQLLAGDPRTTMRDGCVRLISNSSAAFGDLVIEVQKGSDLTSCKLSFAWGLHYADQYDLCLQITDGILARDQRNVESLTLKADTLIHLERTLEAKITIEQALTLDEKSEAAWEVLSDVYLDLKDWKALLTSSAKALTLGDEGSKYRFYAVQHQAIAHCGLGNMTEMESWIDKWVHFNSRVRKFESIRKMVFRRAGKS